MVAGPAGVKDFNPDRDGIQLQDAMLAFFRDTHRIIVARGTFDNIPAGNFTEQLLQWEKADGLRVWAAKILYVQVVQTAGAAAGFDSEIRKLAGGTGIEIAWQYLAGAGRIDVTPSPPVPFLSEETVDDKKYQLPFAIKPVGGAGSYDVIVYAHRSR
jgi:hypothetical protein